MGCLVFLILLVVLFGTGVAFTVGVIGLVLTLVMSGLVGWAADLIIPAGALPGGWLGAVLTGLIGGFVGAWLFGALHISDPGFVLFGVHLIPAFIGEVLVALG